MDKENNDKTMAQEEIDEIEHNISVMREKVWQIIEQTSDEKALTLFPWLTKQSLVELREKIMEERTRENSNF